MTNFNLIDENYIQVKGWFVQQAQPTLDLTQNMSQDNNIKISVKPKSMAWEWESIWLLYVFFKNVLSREKMRSWFFCDF